MKLPCRSRLLWCCILTLWSLACGVLSAQDFAPAQAQKVDAATQKAIKEKAAALDDTIEFLRSRGLDDMLVAEVEVYQQAAQKIVKHNEFFQKESAAWTLEALEHGIDRAKQIVSKAKKGPFWLATTGRSVVRGYRSILDGSVQPYAVTLPENYGDGNPQKFRVDIVLHGRDANLTEVKFVHNFHDKPAPKDLQYVKIDIYGRGNNAYRWAGEIDVLEALATFKAFEDLIGRSKLLDPRRLVLRGFSMGGAGTWHLGLHRPDRFCVIGPGAGFSATHGYIKNLPKDLGWPKEQLLRIYDAVDYAENAFNVPVVAYAGSKDPQLQAARNIEAALKATDLPVDFKILVAPDLEHKFPPEWQEKAEEAYAPFVAKGRPDYPKRVRFVTYTLKYPICDWVEILGLGRHYDKAVVDAEKTEDGFKVTTSNVQMLRLRVPKGNLQEMTVLIDKQEVNARPWSTKGGSSFHVYLQRNPAGAWQATMPQKINVQQARKPRKVSGVQGPIDDAFTLPFLCVRGSGTPWSDRTDEYAEANLKRFQAEWAKYMRGQLPIKEDRYVTSEDIADKNLILFGDPASNTMIAQVLDGLPLTWTKDTVELHGLAKKFAAGTHVPVLIYPNPLNPGKYVVLNSGHTFHAEDFQGTNALLYPRLGDYAVLELTAKGPALGVEQVAVNGLFDESWQVSGNK
jgi:dienelactone hydrolase